MIFDGDLSCAAPRSSSPNISDGFAPARVYQEYERTVRSSVFTLKALIVSFAFYRIVSFSVFDSHPR